ncbi:MAG: glycosyltransferase [Terriglobales bacterium]
MSAFLWWIAGVMLAWVWIGRFLDALGMRKIPDIALPDWDCMPQPAPSLSIIVPARNEQTKVEAALTSLLRLEYPDCEILAVDDRSSDATGEIMDRIASAHPASPALKVLHVRDLPPGWLGKPHAMWTAAQQARGEWLLFTDADVTFRPDSLRRALAHAEAVGADHLVVFPTHQLRSLGEKIMMAGFQMPFVFGHRPWRVHDPKAKDFIGLGAFNLIRREAYEAVGTFKVLRMEVVDDMKLGKLVKLHGWRQRNVFGSELLELHWGSGARGLIANLTKNMFAVLEFRPWKTFGAATLWLFLNFMPVLGVCLADGWARIPYAAALGAIFLLYVGMSRRTVPVWAFFVYPLSAALIVFTLLRSMAHTLRHRGIIWRDTHYSLEELRKGLM